MLPCTVSTSTSNLSLPTDLSGANAMGDLATEAGNNFASHGCNIDGGSQVFNGDLMSGQQPAPFQQHIITGGSVNNGSLLVNGDIDRKSLDRLLGGKGSD